MTINNAIVVFLDGVGLGANNAPVNPFVVHPPPLLTELLDGHPLVAESAGYSNTTATLLGLDACLGVAGLPQSGTGQTAILTGLNAPAVLGKHDGPYPNKILKAMLQLDTLFHQLRGVEKPVAYAGAYPDRFFARLKRGTERLSANTRAAHDAGLSLRGPTDLQAGQAISALITNRYWREWGYDVPLLNPTQAGEQLARLSQSYTLTFFEFWYTDVIGHKQDMAMAQEVLTLLDSFLSGIIEAINLKSTLLLVISDHGNFEDLSTKQHTLNPTLTLAVGAGHQLASQHLSTLLDITPWLTDLLGA